MTVRIYSSTDVGAPLGPAYNLAGQIIGILDACLVNGYGSKAPAGWSKPYSGTNIGVYRPGAGTRMYYRIDDSFVNAYNSRIRVWESMTDVNTGINEWPTDAQQANSRLRRTYTGNEYRPWMVIADERTCYWFVNQSNVTGPVHYFAQGFGDFYSYEPAATYNAFLCSETITTSSADDTDGNISRPHSAFSSNLQLGVWFARSITKAAGGIRGYFSTDLAKITSDTTSVLGYNDPNDDYGLIYPHPPDGALWVAPLWLTDANSLYGEFRGLWCPLHKAPLAHGDTFTGGGDLAGKTLMVVNIGYSTSSSNYGQLLVETTDWKTN